nr:lysine-rich arabinogalactan protein 19-like [Aegilops tauschii subsp. strangulata]XP_040258353.1 lysine-rich arabinogalactan protein 19-like [Aegilops tauschii subsp. strangulata]
MSLPFVTTTTSPERFLAGSTPHRVSSPSPSSTTATLTLRPAVRLRPYLLPLPHRQSQMPPPTAPPTPAATAPVPSISAACRSLIGDDLRPASRPRGTTATHQASPAAAPLRHPAAACTPPRRSLPSDAPVMYIAAVSPCCPLPDAPPRNRFSTGHGQRAAPPPLAPLQSLSSAPPLQ